MKRCLWVLLCGGGCAVASVEHVSLELAVRGMDPPATFETNSGSLLELERAALAFGPLYLCASRSAGERCETARLEWLESAIVDLLEPAPQVVGVLRGVSGPVRSYMFDLGRAATLTSPRPVELPAARELGGASLLLRGNVEGPSGWVPFQVDMPLESVTGASSGLPLIQSAAGTTFSHEVTGKEKRLEIEFDVYTWLRAVDFTPYFSGPSCGEGAIGVSCEGQLASACATDGSVEAVVDCAEQGEFCVFGTGCVETLVLTSESIAYRSIQSQVVAGSRPRFEWVR